MPISSPGILLQRRAPTSRFACSAGKRRLFTASCTGAQGSPGIAKVTPTPLLFRGSHRFGVATKNALRGIRIQGYKQQDVPQPIAPSLTDPCSTTRGPPRGNYYAGQLEPGRDNTAWLLIGGLAALGLGGIALSGYLNQEKRPVLERGANADLATQRFVRPLSFDKHGRSWSRCNRLRATYGYTFGGLATTAVSAICLFRVGAAHRVVAMNPWLFLGASVLGTVGSLMVMQSLPPEHRVARHATCALTSPLA
jgi:hypothetical protein